MMGTRSIAGKNRRRQRVQALAMVWGLLCLVLVGRLVQVQGVRHKAYLARARRQHERRIELKARRGRILDRHGRTMAVDAESRSFYANPALVEDPDKVAAHFAPLVGRPASRLVRQLRRDGHFVYLARQLDEAQSARAMSREFTGVKHHAETRRHYPQGGLAAQVLGYTDIDNKGGSGVEWALDSVLRGTDGAAVCNVDATGRPVPGSSENSLGAQDGSSVVLTLDMVYQDILEQELDRAVQSCQAEAATGIITEPRTGEILAMANLPLFDPNRPGDSPPRHHRNRAVTDAYEPGSTFKIFTLAAVLEQDLVELNEPIDCGLGRIRLRRGSVIRDHQPFDTLSVRDVIKHSSNIGTIRLAQHLSPRQLYEFIRRFGFGTYAGSGLPGESPGLLAEVGDWSERSLATIAIGQEISVTALQLAQAVGAIANDGLLLTPHIVKGVITSDGRYEPGEIPAPVRQVVSPATAAQVRGVLEEVVKSGTGRLASIEGVRIAGKTGTAQKAALDGSGYEPDSNVVSFVGFLPADDPHLLCLIVVDNPQRNRWGGRVAAPAFGRVIERILHLPDGPGIPAKGRAVAAEDRIAEIPDLRGMSRRAARFQAGLRGLPVAFSGDGELVVAQRPAPGSHGDEFVQISCALGQTRQEQPIEVQRGLARQANLLRRMKVEALAAGEEL